MGTGSLTVPSAKAEITFPRADKDLLIFLASSRTAPSAPVLLTCEREEKAVSCIGLQKHRVENSDSQDGKGVGGWGVDVNPPGMQGKIKVSKKHIDKIFPCAWGWGFVLSCHFPLN